MTTPCESLSLCKVLSESGRIIRLHRYHFQALTVLFLFPLSLCFLLYPTIQTNLDLSQSDEQSSSLQTHKLFQALSSNSFLNFNQTPYSYLLLSLFYTLFVTLFSLFAMASISFSTYHVSRDEPVDLISSIKSISYSFWPLVSTTLISSLIGVLIVTPFALLVFLGYKWLLHSSYFIPLVILIGLIFAVVLIHLQVNWTLAYVVVVAESKWGYAPLERSAYLVKGNRRVALSTRFYFGLLNGVFSLSFYGSRLGGWWFILCMIFGSFCASQVLLVSFVATTVLYVYCRESHEGAISDQYQEVPLLK